MTKNTRKKNTGKKYIGKKYTGSKYTGKKYTGKWLAMSLAIAAGPLGARRLALEESSGPFAGLGNIIQELIDFVTGPISLALVFAGLIGLAFTYFFSEREGVTMMCIRFLSFATLVFGAASIVVWLSETLQ